MGKLKRNRAVAHRSDPISVKAVKPPTDPELLTIREKKVLPVIKNLKGSDPKSRASAAGAVANIVQDERCRKLLLREQIVPLILTETLTDNSLESRAAGWEILRTIAAEEESDFCVHLYRLDILSAIEHAAKNVIQAVTSSEAPFTKTPRAQQQVIWNIATALLSLLVALATARDEVLDSIACRDEIFRFLFILVSQGATPAEVLDEALSCLTTLSEDNMKVPQLILADQSGCFRALMKFKDAGDSKAVYACGVLNNMYSALSWHDYSPGQDGATPANLIPTLSGVLGRAKQDSRTNELSANVPVDALQLSLEILASIASDLQGALEKANKFGDEWNGIQDYEEKAQGEDEIMNLDGKDDVLDSDDAEDEDGDDVEMGDDEIAADMDMVTGGDAGDIEDDSGAGIDDIPTLRDFIQQVLPQLIRLANIPPSSKDTLAVQSHALAALNNITWTVSCLDFSEGDNASIFKVWAPAAKRIWTKVIVPTLATDTADVELASLTTSIAWAVSRTLQGSTPLAGDEHKKFMSLYKATKRLSTASTEPAGQDPNDPLEGLGVKCIGVLGQLAKDPAPVDLNREVGVFLITTLEALPETPVADAVEALNQLMDIYGDESLTCDNEVFWKYNFVKHLEDIFPKARSMAKLVDKRKMGELRARADEAVLNLGRFLKYKTKHAPK